MNGEWPVDREQAHKTVEQLCCVIEWHYVKENATGLFL